MQKTKPWIIAVFVLLFVFVYYLCIWLLLGEFNLAHLDFVVLAQTQRTINDVPNFSPAYLSIDSRLYLFVFIPPLIWGALLFGIRLGFKFLVWDGLPLIIGSYVTWLSLLFSAGISNWTNRTQAWIIASRFLIVLLTFFVSFFTLNKLTNTCLMHSRHAPIFLAHAVDTTQQQKAVVDTFYQQHPQLFTPTIIDIPVTNIFIRKQPKTKQGKD